MNTDKILFQCALANLINNAIKYTGKNGRITIDMHCSSDYLEIGVSDNGVGIDFEKQSLIFERFYRAEPSHHFHKNWGLGLSIVKKIMELNKGFVRVKSQIGEGSVFTLYFPNSLIVE